jgi:hypothetical protein
MKRLAKEKKTVEIMVRIFCDARYGTDGMLLCPACAELLNYAEKRLDKCPYGENKSACSKCEIHCYKPEMRRRITEVMQYSGPKIVTEHPLLAIEHLLRTKSSRRRKTISGKPYNI